MRVSVGPFSIDAPDGWTLSSVILAGPVDEPPAGRGLLSTQTVRPFQRNMIVTMEQVGRDETPRSYVKRQIDGLKAAGVPRLEARPPEEVKLPSGVVGLITEQVITTAEGERVRQMQLVAIRRDVAYTLITSHLDGLPFDRVREEFRKMLESFE